MLFGQKYVTSIIFGGILIVMYCFYIYRGSGPVVLKKHHHYHVQYENIEESGMHLITNYPLMTETPWIEAQGKWAQKSALWERQLEVEEVLQRNLDNTLVKAVHLLVTQPSAEERLRKLSFHNKHKIVVRRIEQLPKYKDYFVYVNEKLLNRFVVVLNMDICLGEGFELLNKTFLARSGICYALTRHGRQERRCDMSGRSLYCKPGCGVSLDTYVFTFTRRLNESVLSELDYNANVKGAENRLVWIFRHRLNKKVLNPCEILRTYHSHCINIHGRFRKYKGPNLLKGEGAKFSTGLYE